MTTLILTCLVTFSTLYSVAPQVDRSATQGAVLCESTLGAPVLIAQEKEDEGKKRTRPPVPSLKNLKQIKRSAATPSFNKSGGRTQPVMPTVRPRPGKHGPVIDRSSLHSPSSKSSGPGVPASA